MAMVDRTFLRRTSPPPANAGRWTLRNTTCPHCNTTGPHQRSKSGELECSFCSKKFQMIA